MASIAFKMMIPMVHIITLLLASDAAEAAIGMNWGRETAQRLVPSQVVETLLQNGIKQARIYTADEDILEAFARSGIDLTLSIYNAAAFRSMEDAKSWVQKRAPYFSSANIRAVYLGGCAFFQGLQEKAFLRAAINSLQNLQDALNEDGHGEIKVTFSHCREVLNNVTRPSEAEFLDEIKEEMITTLPFLRENNAPFVIEMFPILPTFFYNIFNNSFAFADNKSTQVVRDINGAVYTNIFALEYDSYVWALKKINASNIKIVVGQVGWPTDGCLGANTANAEQFFRSLLPFVASKKGTPMRPGAPIDIYVNALTDENKLPYKFPFSRHWGIYGYNGEPKYQIDLSGQGRDIFPTMIKGITRMPECWCVFNGNLTDKSEVELQFDYACDKSDCSSISPGGSCSKLAFAQQVSYAFNMHFQFQFQDEEACTFNGLGYVSMDNPSTDECIFPVLVLKSQYRDFIPFGKGLHA